jgi:PST family polysaccharide transporter
MATVFTSVNTIFVDFGTRDAIIRHEEVDRKFLSSIFWFNFSIGVVVYLMMYLISSWIANFYGYPILRDIVRLTSLNILFTAMTIVPRGVLLRNMNFRVLFFEMLIISPISGFVGIYMAWKGFGVWSLVARQMILMIGGNILVWVFVGWFPLLSFDFRHVKQIFSYSSYLSLTKFSNYFTKQGDMFLIGKFLGAIPLGIYSKGYGLLRKPLKMVNGTILPVMFSAISKFQQDIKKLQNTYLKTSQALAIIYFPLWVGSILLAKPVILVLLGEKWEGVIPLMPIFMTNLMFISQSSIGSHYLNALGETRKLFRIALGNAIVIILSFVIGLRWGITGVAIGYCLAVIFGYCIFTFFVSKRIELPIKEILLNPKEVYFNGSLMVILIVIVQVTLKYLNLNSDIVELLVAGFFGVGIYVLSTWITIPEFRVLTLDFLNLGENELRSSELLDGFPHD